MIRLREHQVDAKARILAEFGFPARADVPKGGARATVVSATGSGKTYTAASATLEMLPRGRILVLVPTLDLLVQTARAWRAVGHRSPMVAVCSLERDEVLDGLGVRCTTNPIQLALWAGRGPVVVLATYASLVERDDPDEGAPPGVEKVPGPLELALAGGELMYGQRLDPFDLAVVDEAHRTAGDTGRPWAAVHDQDRIPAGRRLYLTATPRILAAPRPPRGKDGREQEIASMTTDSATYGRQIVQLGLAEAVERGILAGFEIDVLEIRDPAPLRARASEEERRGRRLALLQTALLEHAAAHDLHTVMTFHQRVEEAKAFAARLPETAAELYTSEVGSRARRRAAKLPPSQAEPYGLEPDRHVPADRVWAEWLCGDHLVSERRDVLRQFADGTDAKGRSVHRAFLASVRVLGEGVDIVGARGVEAICFADTRGSQVEIVQNIGRALRPNPDGTTKTARILVPVFLGRDEDPRDMIASASYAPLVAVLQGLRSHDERLVEQLASHALTRAADGGRHPRLRRDSRGRIVESPDDAANPLLRFSTPRDPATVAAFLRTRVYRPESLVWLEGLNALRRWRAEHHHTGLVSVPYDTEVALGVTRFPLGRWVAQQRRALRTGELDEHRKFQLDEAGMVWEPGDEAWEGKLAAFRAFHRAHDHLAPRQDAVWLDEPVGQHLANLRRTGGLGKDPERAGRRAAQLAAIDPDWNCPWPLDWQRQYAVLRDLVAADGSLPDIRPGVTFDGDDLGRWAERQRQDWRALSEAQRERLSALGLRPAKPPRPGAKTGTGKASAAFTRGLAALGQYVQREARTTIPRGHEETLPDGTVVKLGIWYSNTKTRRAGLSHTQRSALAQLGVDWA
ncbi:DEAD/DEAH box helicase [Streptomyces sp. WM6378]|uniref:DEAD/DEAH box helicase n=1 Tax=Streptomyces sp. WM6378 TaxID=1415557 RepID=UPI0006ADE0F4|nr:DEAD/DEAH box helicase [Streptomyces sp. WM6378]